MQRSEYTQKNIDLLCSVSKKEERYFTEHQLDLINSLKAGLTPADIAKKWGRGVSNSYRHIIMCASKLDAIRSHPDGVMPQKAGVSHQKSSRRINYQDFAGADLSSLKKLEREILTTRIDHPGLTIQQIATMYDIPLGTCATILRTARKKVSGEFADQQEKDRQYRQRRYQEKRDEIRAVNRQYYEDHKDQYREIKKDWWGKNRDKMLERQRDYNKVYYQQHREALIQKSKERRKATKEKRQQS